jgi:hypothetical protein
MKVGEKGRSELDDARGRVQLLLDPATQREPHVHRHPTC